MAQVTFKGSHFPKCVILQTVFWYLRYALSYRDIEELMEERGVNVDHSTMQRWVVKYTPLLETEIRKRKKAVGSSWRMDETYIKIKGIWHYLYRAVDKKNNTIDFLLTKKVYGFVEIMNIVVFVWLLYFRQVSFSFLFE